MPNKYEFTPEMREISGFGGSYEEACRIMVRAGMEWLDAHPDADPQFAGFKNVYGIISDSNADAEALTKAIMDAPVADPDTGEPTTIGKAGATGAMHQAAVSHCMFIRKNGWDAYVERMSQPSE